MAKPQVFTFGAKPGLPATAELQKMIDDVAAKGGGLVTVPPGDHVVGSIALKSGIELRLEKGARILGTQDWRDYPLGSLIAATDAANVSITGEGVIDVRGDRRHFIRKETPVRPNALRFENCANIMIENIAILNSAAWTVVFTRCDGVVVRGIQLFSHANHNNDGIDVCGTRNVLIENSRIDADDDGIVLKAWDENMVVENVEVRNCRVASNCNFLKIGTESKGFFRNIVFHDCEIVPPAPSVAWDWMGGKFKVPGLDSVANGISAIAIETVDGGCLENVAFRNISIKGGAQTAIFVRLGCRHKVDGRISCLKDVTIEKVKGKAISHIACSITGCAEDRENGVPAGIRPRNILLRNIDLEFPGGCAKDGAPVPEKHNSYPENRMFDWRPLPAYGFYVRHADDIRFENVSVRTGKPDERPPFFQEDSTDVTFKNCNVQSDPDLT